MVADYNTPFNNLCADLKWNELALISQHRKGLQHCVKTQTTFLNPRPATLAELPAAATNFGNLYTELDASCPSKTSHTSAVKKGKGRNAPTTTNTTRSDVKLSLPNYVEKEEGDARQKEGLCIKCGAPDHTMKQCKNRYSIAHLSTNRGAGAEKKEHKKETGKVAQEMVCKEESGSEESENE